MKSIVLALAVLATSTAFAGEPALGTPYEVEPKGCLMNDTHGSCVFLNTHETEVVCDLTISATTTKGMKLGNTRRRAIRNHAFIQVDVYSTSDDPIVSVKADGVCGTIN